MKPKHRIEGSRVLLDLSARPNAADAMLAGARRITGPPRLWERARALFLTANTYGVPDAVDLYALRNDLRDLALDVQDLAREVEADERAAAGVFRLGVGVFVAGIICLFIGLALVGWHALMVKAQ